MQIIKSFLQYIDMVDNIEFFFLIRKKLKSHLFDNKEIITWHVDNYDIKELFI